MSVIVAALIGFSDIGLWICAGVFLGATLLGLRLPRARYLRSYSGGFILRRPWEGRVLLGLIGLASLLLPLVLIGDTLRFHTVLPRETWIEAGAFTGICWVGAAFFFWQSGPRELVLDESQHTYRRTEGWPPFQRIYTGPLSNLSGVWAESNTDHNSYSVFVGWRDKLGKMVVGQFFSSIDGAEYFADELAVTLGIPRPESDPSAPPLPYRVPADLQRPQWIVQDGRTVLFQEWAAEQEAQELKDAE